MQVLSSWRENDKTEQKPAICCKNPQANRMNAYIKTSILYVLYFSIVEVWVVNVWIVEIWIVEIWIKNSKLCLAWALEEKLLTINRNLHFATKILKKIVWTHTPQRDFIRFVQNRFLKIRHWRWIMKNSLLWTCMFLLNKFFKKITETYTLLQKSSRKSYERIHHNAISYVSCKTDFWKLIVKVWIVKVWIVNVWIVNVWIVNFLIKKSKLCLARPLEEKLLKLNRN